MCLFECLLFAPEVKKHVAYHILLEEDLALHVGKDETLGDVFPRGMDGGLRDVPGDVDDSDRATFGYGACKDAVHATRSRDAERGEASVGVAFTVVF